MSGLSVVIIARNEEANLPRCLDSVSWADEIVIVDNESTDRTLDIARQYGAKVFQSAWLGFGGTKRVGVNKATGEWILSVDADEVVPPELADEIRSALQNSDKIAGYYMPRRTSFLGRWIYHCGWYPDPVLRLFRKESGNFDESVVHEKVEIEGPTARLHNDLLHYSYPTLDSYFDKFNRYTRLAAEEAHRRGDRAGAYDIIVRPAACFVKHYFLRRGFLDGLEGLMISALSACYVLAKYAKLRDLARRRSGGEAQVS